MGNSFVASCVVFLKPEVNDYTVTFYFEGKPLGQYVTQEQPSNNSTNVTWETLNTVPGLNIYGIERSVAENRRFRALFEPYSTEAEGEYRCSVALRLGTGRAQFYSHKWHGKQADSKPALLPDVTLKFNTSHVLNGIKPFEYFVGTCNVQLRPNDTNYYVSIYLQNGNNRYGAMYSVEKDHGETSVTYSVLSNPSYNGIELYKQLDQYPNYSVLFTSRNQLNEQWKFSCELKVSLANDGVAMYSSNIICSMPNKPCNF